MSVLETTECRDGVCKAKKFAITSSVLFGVGVAFILAVAAGILIFLD